MLDHVSITLSGLCNDGMILLPVFKNPDQEKRSREEKEICPAETLSEEALPEAVSGSQTE